VGVGSIGRSWPTRAFSERKPLKKFFHFRNRGACNPFPAIRDLQGEFDEMQGEGSVILAKNSRI
jgi:hypothetical protein